MTDFSLRVQWLMQHQNAKEKAQEAANHLQEVQARLTKVTPSMSGMPSTSSCKDKMSEGISQLSSARLRLENASREAEKKKRLVYSCIMKSGLKEQDARMLVLMYIDGATQNQAADIIGKSSAGGTYIHRRAVAALKMPPGWHEQLQ
ncbi:hypothetical protein [uncultured Subdoligranulum sp.]|uniref:hypothetical protein n=1 Tax=uncultured Subdoligranulum sp. TaxID=512298 RepID=UPI002604BA63|nr:hypothetical protein [uncultured Subdoligranulum sp.]